jgi:protein phosphatase 1 regulatory subunit 10
MSFYQSSIDPNTYAMFQQYALQGLPPMSPVATSNLIEYLQRMQPTSQHQQVFSPGQGAISPQALHIQQPTISSAAFYSPPPTITPPSAVIPPQWAAPIGDASMSDIIELAGPPPGIATRPPPTPAVPKETPEQKKARFLAALKPRLQTTGQSNPFSGAGAVAKLIQVLDDYGFSQVEADTRLEILSKIRDKAGNNYFRAWSENDDAIDLTRQWLKAATIADTSGKDDAENVDVDERLADTLMPLLSASCFPEHAPCYTNSIVDCRPVAHHA